jgi:hypothetical protein
MRSSSSTMSSRAFLTLLSRLIALSPLKSGSTCSLEGAGFAARPGLSSFAASRRAAPSGAARRCVASYAPGLREASIAARKASENSRALWNRSSRLLARAFCSTVSTSGERRELSLEGSAGRLFNTCCITVAAFPEKGLIPVRSS